ncbi:hypothetical protein [Hymenobacter antarcticus]|uniref:DUF4397 domain-containing protein n=1 Tax=Hymenobacter antarcticus TaxID=486270 RepID=A0ABP7QTI1_9BACT
MKFSFVSLVTKLTLATSVAGALVGCDDPTYPTPTPVTTSSVGQAQVLVVNAAPGTTGTSITLDNAAFGSALPYLGVSTATSVAAGLRLFIYNEPTNIPATPVVTPPPTIPLPVVTVARPVVSRAAFLGGTNYTTFITDLPTRAYAAPVTATSDQGGIRLVTLTDNLAPPAVATNAKIRFVNLAPTATGGSTTYGIFNSLTQAPLFSAVPIRAYRATTNTSTATPPVTTTFANFTEVAAGTYTLDVRSVATTPLPGTLFPTTFVAGKIYTLYTRGIAGNTTTPLGISVVTHN